MAKWLQKNVVEISQTARKNQEEKKKENKRKNLKKNLRKFFKKHTYLPNTNKVPKSKKKKKN